MVGLMLRVGYVSSVEPQKSEEAIPQESPKSVANVTAISSRQVSTGEEQFVSLTQDGTVTRIPVSISERHIRAGLNRKNAETEKKIDFVLFEVQGKTRSELSWSCAEILSASPHGFKIFPANGNTYAVYVVGSGIRVFEIRGSNTAESALNQRVSSENRGIALLPVDTFLDVYGTEFRTDDALHFPIVVDQVYQEKGVFFVVIHGNDRALKHTFVCKDGKWNLLRQ